jgi:hypothetical protein
VASGTLFFDSASIYKITAQLNSNNSIHLVGAGTARGAYATTCSWGIKTTSNITALRLTGPSPTVDGMCLHMGTTAGDRTSGAAIHIGAQIGVSTVNQGHALVRNNTIINPFDGILNGGNTTGTGTVTQTNGTVISDNVVINPARYGIANGLTSTGISTAGTWLQNNQIPCFQTSVAGSVGYAFFDGAVNLSAGDVGPYACDIGTLIRPGAGQGTLGSFSGVLGDTPRTHGLLIDAVGNGAAYNLRFVNWYAATLTNTVAGGSAVTVRNTSAVPTRVNTITFDGGSAHGCNAGTGLNIMQILNDVYNVQITNNMIHSDCSQTNDTGILINTSGNGGTARILVQGNTFSPVSGQLARGVVVTGTGDAIDITNNYFGEGVATADDNSIVWTTGPTTRAVIQGNLTLATITPSVASAAAIAAPMAEQMVISGTTTVSTMSGMWLGRKISIFPAGVFNFATGGGTGKFCNAVTTVVGVPLVALWNGQAACWGLK